jgi:sodium-dependent dicarboxylate transporter 2/3/5
MSINLSQKRALWMILGPATYVVLVLGYPNFGLSLPERGVLAVTAWMAVWWVTEALPTAVTALLPIIMFPISGVVGIADTTRHYGHPYIFLFLGGFLLATAMEKCSLHRRIALGIIRLIGTRSDRIVLGFMLATAFVSMWISNTATAVMLMPVATSLLQHRYERKNGDALAVRTAGDDGLAKALMLGVAYSASIGGMATLIGTPPNLVLAGVWNGHMGTSIGFTQWMLFAVPICVLLLLGTWWYLTHVAFPFIVDAEQQPMEEVQIIESGPLHANEIRVLFVFVAMVVAWVFRSLLIEPWLPALDDTSIALCGGVILFLIPNSNGQGALLEWSDTQKLPWGILLLFGGGMALAHGFEQSGLAAKIGQNLVGFKNLHPLLFVFLVVIGMSLLTEFTSNLAATTMILPVLIPVAGGLGQSPLYILTAAALAASCAFMMPVSTPPNAVVFATGHLKVSEMTRVGFFVNVLSAVVISLGIHFYMPFIFK